MNFKLKSSFFSFFKVILFLFVCLVISFAIIFPLWAFASNAPKIYSAVVLIAAAAIALWKLFFLSKKAGARKTIFIMLKILIALAGIFGCFYFLLAFKRVLSLAALIAAVILFKITDVVSKRNK